MSSICGLLLTNGRLVEDQEIQQMITNLEHWNPDKKDSWIKNSVAFGHLMLHNTIESLQEELPFNDSESNICITSDARIDNRELLCKLLNFNLKEATERPDSWYILNAYKKWGTKCVEHLEGDFAFAIWDEPNKRLFCARDQLGIKPLYYYFKDGIFAFSTEAKGILALNSVNKNYSEQWIADFLLNIRHDRHLTFHESIFKLEAAHTLTLTDNNIELKKYWELNTEVKTTFSSEGEYVEAFLEKLNSSVSKRLRSNWSISSELSGGLDSSTVTSVAQQLLKKKTSEIISISDVLPYPIPYDDPILSDDREQIMDVIKHAEIKNYHFVTGEEKTQLNSLLKSIAIHDEPPVKFVNIFADLIYEKAESQNSRVLLSGFGGDDVVSYAGYFFLEELFRQGKWKKLWQEVILRTSYVKSSPYKRLSDVILSASLEPKGINYKHLKWKYKRKDSFEIYQNKFIRSGIHPDLSRRLNMEDRFFKKRIYSYEGRTMNEKIASRLIHPRILHHRLEYCNIATAHHRLEYRYPLLDLPLIQFFTSVPSTEKIKNGWSRYFFRNAIEGIVPDRVRWEYINTGSSSPSGLLRKARDKNLMIEALKNIPKDAAIHNYMDLETYIKHVEEIANKPNFLNHGGERPFLLHNKLEQMASEK